MAAATERTDLYGSYDDVLTGLGGGALADVWEGPVRIETLAHFKRPYSRLERVRIHHAQGTTDAFVKRLRVKEDTDANREVMRSRVIKEFDLGSLVHRTFTASGWPAVRPLACLPQEFAVVTEAFPGEELLAALERDAAWYPSSERLATLAGFMGLLGEWVRRFQAMNPPTGTVSLDAMREYLDLRLRRLVDVPDSGFSEVDRSRVLRYFDLRRREVDAADLQEVLVHADFGPSNVLVHGNTAVVLDFAMAHPGTKFNDLARMYTQLELLSAKPQFRVKTIERLQTEFLSGYRPGLTSEHPLLDLLIMQNRITHLLMTLVQKNGGLLARAYNWHLARRARRWARAKTVGMTAMREI